MPRPSAATAAEGGFIAKLKLFAEAKKDPRSFFTPYARVFTRKFVVEAKRKSQYYTAVVFRTDTDRATGNVWRGDSSAPAERRLVDLIQCTCKLVRRVV
jgi:hypothetical protein